MKKLTVLIIIALVYHSCKVGYSFTGASIAPDINTIAIQNFPNFAPLVQPTLSQTFTERLKNKFTTQTRLKLVRADGDLNLEGQITNYYTQPISIQANETASQNRLTVSVLVKFTNKKNEKDNFEKTFTRYADYDSRLQLSSVEPELIRQITNQLVDDIFNDSVSKW